MTRKDLDTLWQKALTESIRDGEQFTRYHFAQLVAAHEREACAKIIQRAGLPSIADAIRARGKG
jgi:hypothetical protein